MIVFFRCHRPSRQKHWERGSGKAASAYRRFPWGLRRPARQKVWRIGAFAARMAEALPFRSHPMHRPWWSIAGSCRQTARSVSRNFKRSRHAHQRSGWRQTEYQRPRFSCCHFGSEQSFFRIAAEAVGSEGGGGVELEHAARATIRETKSPGPTNVPRFCFPAGAGESR